MPRFLIRNDDVAFETEIDEIRQFCEICDKYGYKIIQAITPIGLSGRRARTHMQDYDIKRASFKRFQENIEVLEYLKSRQDLIAVHGLWHTHKPSLPEIRTAKKILGSLGLKPTYFAPPFNEGHYPETVAGLKLCQLSMEAGERLEDFLQQGTPKAPIMYLHSWRFNNAHYKFKHLDQCLARLSNKTNASQPDQVVFEQNMAYYTKPKNVRRYITLTEEGLWDIERDLVHAFMPAPPGRLLDLGCGAGRTSGDLAKAGYLVTAIDLSQPLIEHARQRYPEVDFQVMNAVEMAFPDETFDAAFFSNNGIDCVFPLTDRLRCLAEVWRVLKPGGVFIISTHNLIGHFFADAPYHDPKNANRLLASQRQNQYLFDWYALYDAHGGPQLLFSAPPSTTQAQLENTGFEILDIRGRSGSGEAEVFWREPHIFFVGRKRKR